MGDVFGVNVRGCIHDLWYYYDWSVLFLYLSIRI